MYKEDFQDFRDNLEEMTDFIIDEKGEEVISERHQKDFKKEENTDSETNANGNDAASSFTDVSFDDI